ncbi:restriction endonuclease subunit S [Bacteroides finegoldii]|jgi:type I restriction enzyme S subunit|uniref:restriction endonuclease subunit S n=1 Tax=Bacteroides finegoldii TaxID=338188 RepID=UPI0022E0DCE0|nr:restriction endonuclease subunit S [Bacteroides finegoldii]
MEEMILQDICKIYDCPHTTAKDEGVGIPLVRTPNVGKGRLVLTNVHRVNSDVYKKRTLRAIPEEDDIIIAREAPVGNAAIIQKKQKVCLGQRVVLLKPNKALVDPNFLVYYLLSNEVQHHLKIHANGAVVAHLNVADIRNLSVCLPSLCEQKKIGKSLKIIDDKIELNRRINDNLEQQAQALFKSWFVDFEPFKDGKFVESELGMIPEGCRVGKAEDFYNINIGKTPPRKEQVWFSSNSSDYIWVSISDLGSCGRFVLTSSELLTHEAIKKYNIILVPKDTILLSFKLTIGRVGIAGTELTTNEAIARFITSDKNREYTYFLLKGYNYEKLGSTSSIATAVNSKIIKAMVVLMPDKEILKAFSSLTKPYFDQILRNEQESIRLTILRDTLLPKLMSGELKINATEVL